MCINPPSTNTHTRIHTPTHTAGPYLIACNNDRIFWMVNADNHYSVEATRDIKQASAFFIFPNEDGGHPYEFVIGYYGDSPKVLKQKASILIHTPWPEMNPIPRYLHAPVGVLGNNFGPLHLKNHMLESQSRLTLDNRLLKHYTPVDIAPWVDGRDVFFINCARRRAKRDGYICVKSVTSRRGGRPELRTGCVPTKRSHNERNTWMLFRLLPVSLRDKPVVPAGDHNEPDVPSDGAAVHFESGSDTTKFLPSTGGKHLDETAQTIPLPRASVDLPELAGHQSTDPTKSTTYSNSTV